MEYTGIIAKIAAELETYKDRSAWDKGVNMYAWELLDEIQERANSCPVTEWKEGGHTYTAAFSVSCSCSYVYARGVYTRDGHNTTLTAIKNSLGRLKKAQDCNIAA